MFGMIREKRTLPTNPELQALQVWMQGLLQVGGWDWAPAVSQQEHELGLWGHLQSTSRRGARPVLLAPQAAM